MALTPDDVVTKQFQHVRFKEGFDPDEVDDFLDEIVVEWRKALEENAELKAKLAAYESGEQAPAAEAVPAEEAPAEVPVEEPVTEAAAETPAGAEVTSSSAVSIIERAQRLHDEHVAEGKTKGEQLVSEAQAQAAKILSDSEAKERKQTARLEEERTKLEGRISELRQFERDYRAQLRALIEGKLKDLDASATPSGSTPVSAIGL